MIKLRNAGDDIIPLSDFRNNLAKVMQRLKEHKSPVILTQSGRAAAVVMSIEAYEQLLGDLELARQGLVSMVELAKGEHPSYEGIKRREGR